MISKFLVFSIFLSFFVFFDAKTSLAEAPYRVHQNYEDTVRIAIIWNNATGVRSCDSSTLPVGQKTLDFVKLALNPERVPNIKDLRNTTSRPATWVDVRGLWGEDTIPHVIVHVNAGWSTGWNGPDLDTIFSRAIDLKIGIVSIGDDAANLSSKTFGFDGVSNMPEPLSDATDIDSLWIGLLRANDDRLKTIENGTLAYPGVNGIISNTVDSILKDTLINFLPYGEGRCEADADRYDILYPHWITMLGYQQGYWDGEAQPGANELNVLVAIQDTTGQNLIRRGVALSFQPSFLENSLASQQLTYDAIMFGSLTHTLSVANKIVITVSSDTLHAGETINVSAEIFDQKGISLTELLPGVQWKIVNPEEGDSISRSTGGTTSLTGTKAWRTDTLEASVVDPKTGSLIMATAEIAIMPGDPHHLDILTAPDVPSDMLNDNYTQVAARLSSTSPSVTLYSIVRDRFNNFVRASDQNLTTWTSADLAIARASGQPLNASIGTVSLSGNGSTTVSAAEGTLIPDTASVNGETTAVNDAVTADTDGDGLIDRVIIRFDVPATVTLENEVPLTLIHDGKVLQVSGISTRSGGTVDSVFYLEVTEDETWGLQTDWTVTLNGTVKILFSEDASGFLDISGVKVKDGIGPVMEKAILHPSSMRYSDTLFITLSEPVKRDDLASISPQSAFNFYLFTDETSPDSRVLQRSRFVFEREIDYTDQLRIILSDQSNASFEITPYKDKMQFVTGSSDSRGNLPPGASVSRMVPVEIAGINSIKISVYPNPLTRGSLESLPPRIREHFANVIGTSRSGMLVAVYSIKPLVQQTDGSYGMAVIYDAVGNLMTGDVRLKKATASNNYGFIWDGKNQNGRNVGTGTYLAIVRCKDMDGNIFVEQVKLGIKR